MSENPSTPESVNIHEAKTHLSRLVDKAMRGELVVIAKAGKPVVKMVPVNAPVASQPKRLGFLSGIYQVPDAETFNALGQQEIEAMFGGDA
jgi:prevent-host-death family protein